MKLTCREDEKLFWFNDDEIFIIHDPHPDDLRKICIVTNSGAAYVFTGERTELEPKPGGLGVVYHLD